MCNIMYSCENKNVDATYKIISFFCILIVFFIANYIFEVCYTRQHNATHAYHELIQSKYIHEENE